MEKVTDKQTQTPRKAPLLATIVSVFKVLAVATALVGIIYIDRAVVSRVDIDRFTRCLRYEVHSEPEQPTTAAPLPAPSMPIEAPPCPIQPPTSPAPSTRIEVTTYDPFIDHVLNGSKTMVFIYGAHNGFPICNEVEALVGHVITLRAYNVSAVMMSTMMSTMSIGRVISRVRVKSVHRVHLIGDIVGDHSMNCGLCPENSQWFCEVPRKHRIYTWFAPNTPVDAVMNKVFTVVQKSSAVIEYNSWPPNLSDKTQRKCSGYSVSDVHGYYFYPVITGEMYTKQPNNVKSRITHVDMITYKFADPSVTNQCFIEIELGGH